MQSSFIVDSAIFSRVVLSAHWGETNAHDFHMTSMFLLDERATLFRKRNLGQVYQITISRIIKTTFCERFLWESLSFSFR